MLTLNIIGVGSGVGVAVGVGESVKVGVGSIVDSGLMVEFVVWAVAVAKKLSSKTNSKIDANFFKLE